MIVRGVVVGQPRAPYEHSGRKNVHNFWRFYYHDCEDGHQSHGLIHAPHGYETNNGYSCNSMPARSYVRLLLSNLDYLEFGDGMPSCDGKKFRKYSFHHKRIDPFRTRRDGGCATKTLYDDAVYIEIPSFELGKKCIGGWKPNGYFTDSLYAVALDVDVREHQDKKVAYHCAEVDEEYTTTLLHMIHDALDKEEEKEQQELDEELHRLKRLADYYDQQDDV